MRGRNHVDFAIALWPEDARFLYRYPHAFEGFPEVQSVVVRVEHRHAVAVDDFAGNLAVLVEDNGSGKLLAAELTHLAGFDLGNGEVGFLFAAVSGAVEFRDLAVDGDIVADAGAGIRGINHDAVRGLVVAVAVILDEEDAFALAEGNDAADIFYGFSIIGRNMSTSLDVANMSDLCLLSRRYDVGTPWKITGHPQSGTGQHHRC